MDTVKGVTISHILILEDDTSHRDLILRAFGKVTSQFRVSVAGTIHEARDIIGRDLPALIIADWMLPDGKGIDILVHRDGMVTVPLIIMTSYGDERLAVEIMKRGAIDYVVKSATMFRDLPHIARRALRDWENIQERVRAEEEARDSQKRLADIISFLPDAVVAIDNDGRVIAWNRAMEQMTGVASGDMLGKGDHEYSLPFYGERRPILIDLVLENNPLTEKKYLYIHHDGQLITSETCIPTLNGGKGAFLWGTASPLFDSKGNRIGAIEVIRDLTERKRNEEMLRGSEAALETLFNATHNTIALLDRQGMIVNINEEGARRLGGSVENITGTCAYDLLPPGIAKTRKAQIDLVFETGKGVWFDDERSGMCIHNEVYPIFNTDHTAVEHIAIFATDITDRKRAESALEESEARFKDLFTSMSSGAVIYEATPGGEDFIIRDINHAVETIENVRKEEVIGKSILEVFPGVREFGLFDLFQRVARTGIAESHPASIYRDTKIEGWRKNYVYKLPSGEIIALYEDITEQKRAEKKLSDLSAYNRNLIEASLDPLVTIGFDGRILDVNAATERATGVRRDDLIGTDFSEYFTEPEKARTGYRRAFSEGKVIDYPLEIRHRDGHTLTVLYNATVFHDSDGNIEGVFASARDITERNRAENALQKSEMRYRAVVEHANEAIIVVQDAIIKFANPKALEIFGNTNNVLVSREFTDFIHPDDRAFVLDRYQRRMLGEDPPVHYDFRIVSEDSLIKWVQISAVRFEWEGKPATLNFLIDITERKRSEEVLRESEEKYRFLIENIEDIVWEATPDLHFTYLSPATEKLTGYPAGELVGKSLFSLLTENSTAQVKEQLSRRTKELIDGKKDLAIVLEVELLKKEGTIVWMEVISKPVIGPQGTLGGFQGTSRDITARKRAEYALRESEGKFRSMVDTSPDMIWEIDKQGNFTYISSRCEVQLGYAPQDLIGKSFVSLIQPGSVPGIAKQFFAHVEGGNSFRTLEVPAKRRDGRLCIIEIRSVRITGNDGDLTGFRGIARDITERRKADEILQENQVRLATAMDIADVVNWEFDVSNGLFSFNDRFYTLYDTTAEREGGYLMPADVYIKEFIYPADILYVTRIISDMACVTDPDYSVEMEHRIVRRDGQIRYLIVHFGVVMDSAGRVIRTYGASQDITGRKLMEEEIRSLNRVLEQRVTERTGQLNAMLTEKELLLREIHHRVKNNLQIIVSLFNLQSRYIADQNVLEVIHESQNRVRAMALVHERIYLSENVGSVDLKEYLTFLGEQVFHYHGVKSSQIKLRLTMPEIRLDVDTVIPLGLVVNELLSNSLKHAFPDGRKGTISILASTGNEDIFLSFSDDGVGFPAGLDWTNPPSLGLRLVISLVRQLNGKIELDPSPGTTFRITATRLQPLTR